MAKLLTVPLEGEFFDDSQNFIERMQKMNFSIIIPTYNRARLLKKSLLRLKKLRYQKGKLEIIIVNNNSTDDTENVVLSFKDKNPNLRIKYIFEGNQGHSFAVNSGVRVAKYSYLILVDDDIFIPNFLDIYYSVYKNNPHAFMVGGKILAKAAREQGRLTIKKFKKRDRWVLGELDLGETRRNLTYPKTLFSGNFSIKLSKKERTKNLFNERLGRRYRKIYLYGEDYELCLQSLLQGKQIIYEPKIYVQNIVEEDRLKRSYVLRRYLLAGIERYVIDQNLYIYEDHIMYRFSLFEVIRDVLRVILLRKNKPYFRWEEISFALGYYFLGRVYWNKNFLRFIFKLI